MAKLTWDAVSAPNFGNPVDGIRTAAELFGRAMSKTENLCGKYCIAFVNAGNIPVEQFAKLLSGSKYSPDQIIANMYRLNYGDNIL